MAKKYLSKKQPVATTMPIFGTDYKLAVPFSVSHHNYYGEPVFNLGNVRFKIEGARGKNWLVALDQIPASWFIDLNAADQAA